MKVEDNSSNIEEVNWKYIPNIYQISQYLPRSDLIQLSSTCKHLTLKLKSKFISKLELIRGGQIIPGKPNISSRRKQLDILFNILEEDYLGKHNFVKHCILWEPCNNSFVTNIFSTFTLVNRLELYSSSDGISRSDLVQILEPLKKLEVLVFDCKFIDSHEGENVPNFKLPTCLKMLDVTGSSSNSLSFDPIEIISEEYIELKKVTIINNNMLDSISASIRSLTEVNIFNSQYFSPKLLTQLFSSNPQLEKVSISLKSIESDVINSILSLKKLNRLNITKYIDENSNELNNLALNTSIKHLYIGGDITQNILLPILSSIESLDILEFSGYDFWNFNTIDWSSYSQKIPLLHLNCVYCTDYNLDILLNSPIFIKIRFTDNFELDYYIKYCSFGNLENWKVIQDDPLNEHEFFLVRKNEDEVDI
jgi:hypothetical protein